MKKLITLFLAAVLLLTCGCSLAQPEEELNTGTPTEDSLIGVLITTEHLDLFDMEAWLNDNLNSITIGGETVIDGDASKYQGRIYAERVEESYTTSDGRQLTRVDFKFPDDIKGEALICPTVQNEDGAYTTTVNGAVFADTHTHLKSTDGGDAIEVTATIYYDPLTIHKENLGVYQDESDPRNGHVVFYNNPVYQTPEGDVYVISGMGHSYSAGPDVGWYGQQGTYTCSQTKSTTVNGKTEELKSTVSITMHAVRYAEKIVVHEMSEDNKLLRTTEYSHDDFPRELTVGSDTAYAVIETHNPTDEGEVFISRQICSADNEEESFTVYLPLRDGYVSKQTTKVVRG